MGGGVSETSSRLPLSAMTVFPCGDLDGIPPLLHPKNWNPSFKLFLLVLNLLNTVSHFFVLVVAW